MPNTGTKKVFKGKRGTSRHYTQFCIDGVLVDEVLKGLPSGIKIFGAKINLGKEHKRVHVPVTNALKKLGVQKLANMESTTHAVLVFDETSKKTITNCVDKVAKQLGLNRSKAHFQYLLLGNTFGTGKFTKTKKDIFPDSNDLRQKLTVLGLEVGEGRVQSLLSDLSAGKYQCDIQEVPVRTVICRKLK